MAKVYVKFPKTGLGNMLLVWANGLVFAEMNNLPMATSSWWGFRWGALLRREKRNRLYYHYFKETAVAKRLLFQLGLFTGPVVNDPPVEKLTAAEITAGKTYLFKKVINDIDLFGSLRNHRDLIKAALFEILHASKKEQLIKYKAPIIGVHIRRGDFKIGNQTTPLSYFINAINLIRKNTSAVLPVTVFTDAEKSELKEILDLPHIEIAEDKADILDILLMSKSRILILSQSSTFSYWAAFLSDAFVIIPFNDWQHQIRKESKNYAEIKWNEADPQSGIEVAKLLKNLDL